MTLNSQYSTEQLYNEWINGNPICEIVKKTGIKRKTWNKRFERYEKQLKIATDNKPQIVKGDKTELVAVYPGDKGDRNRMVSNNTVINIHKPKKVNQILAACALIGSMLAVYFIYTEIKKRRTSSQD